MISDLEKESIPKISLEFQNPAALIAVADDGDRDPGRLRALDQIACSLGLVDRVVEAENAVWLVVDHALVAVRTDPSL